MGLFDIFKKKSSQSDYEPEVVMIGDVGGALKIHRGRTCAQCGATSEALVKANRGMWDGLRFCTKCSKYFCARCQVDNYYECCPICGEKLVNKA